jgi:drug/metabolite transporter (DMT)-like permease
LKHLSASTVAVIILGEPVGSTVLAYLLLGEPVTALKAVGGALILLGIYLSSRRSAAP